MGKNEIINVDGKVLGYYEEMTDRIDVVDGFGNKYGYIRQYDTEYDKFDENGGYMYTAQGNYTQGDNGDFFKRSDK